MDGRIRHQTETRIEAARLFDAGFGYTAVATHLRLPAGTLRDWQDAHRQGRLLDLAVTWIPVVVTAPDFQEKLQWRRRIEREVLRIFDTKLWNERSSLSV